MAATKVLEVRSGSGDEATPEVPIASRIDARKAAGRALRQSVPRTSHADWSPPLNRPDPVDLLQAMDRTRLPELVPVRYGRMIASPFAFLRGAAVVMANDLAATPATGLRVQACGDAHLLNFGSYATPERTQVFDINDFDETLPAPWEWDVKRLAASVVVAARSNNFSADDIAIAAGAAVRSYRERIVEYAMLGNRDLWYARISLDDIAVGLPSAEKKRLLRGAKRARQHDHLQALGKMAEVVDGRIRIADDPPLVMHLSDELVGEHLPAYAVQYRKSVRDDLRELLSRYTFVDFAQKAVGVGSVGTRCYIALFQGNGVDDPLFLQIKEARPSVLEPFAGKSVYRNHGQRVVRGQQYIQAASDIFLGWGRVGKIDLYTRQLRDMKGSVDVATMAPVSLALYARLCGWALARAHARSGDAAGIAGYLGKGGAFDDAVVAFATAYADQTERDHAALFAAVKSGRIAAVNGA